MIYFKYINSEDFESIFKAYINTNTSWHNGNLVLDIDLDTYRYKYVLVKILFHYRLLQDLEYSSLRYAGLHYTVLVVYQLYIGLPW